MLKPTILQPWIAEPYLPGKSPPLERRGARRQPLLGLVGILIRVSLCNVDTVSVCVTQLATASPNHRIS